jgi:hypothetical protein
MASSIDIAIPPIGNPTTAGVRANFGYAKSEIEALQEGMAGAIEYTDIRANESIPSISLLNNVQASTQFILPSPVTAGSKVGGINYNNLTGAIEVTNAGVYVFQFMFNCVATGVVKLFYKAATLGADNVTITPFATAGRQFRFTNGDAILISIKTINYWAAGTKLIIYVTTDAVGSLTLQTTTGVPFPNGATNTLMSARYQLARLS